MHVHLSLVIRLGYILSPAAAMAAQSIGPSVPAAVVQQVPFATHDYATYNGGQLLGSQPDSWADTKSPGGGRTYSVCTTTISKDLQGQFTELSLVALGFPNPATAGSLFGASQYRQAVVVQCADPSFPRGKAWQAGFFGGSANPATQPAGPVSCFARAISVWPAVLPNGLPDPANTRVAICGDSFDEVLLGGLSAPRPLWSGSAAPCGFIAMFDGNGVLLWSHHLYGRYLFASTAVTDLVVRRSGGDDIVTYCGASTNGFYDAQQIGALSTMDSVRPFIAPQFSMAGGDTHTGIQISSPPSNFDGFVGRISVPNVAAGLAQGPVSPIFHSIIASGSQDGMFGIAEDPANPDKVTVVGATTSAWPGASTVQFPFTDLTYNGATHSFSYAPGGAPWEVGVVLTFLDAGPNILLLSSVPLGSPGKNTVARDVLWHNGFCHVVGSTNDSAFNLRQPTWTAPFLSSPSSGSPIPGGADAFAVIIDQGLSPVWATLLGNNGLNQSAGAVAVSAWSEFPDHVAIGGYIQGPSFAGGQNQWARITVDSMFCPPQGLVRTQRVTVDPGGYSGFNASRQDYPGVPPSWNGLSVYAEALRGPAVYYQTSSFELGDGPGGGISMSDVGQVHVAGGTRMYAPGGSGQFPIHGLPSHILPADKFAAIQYADAIRATVDTLPNGLCRTNSSCASIGWALSSGSGGTTPSCALRLFGHTLSAAGPQDVKRVLLDVIGAPVSGAPLTIVVDRPPGAVSSGFVQIGFPLTSPLSLPQFPGLELWLNGSAIATTPTTFGGGPFTQAIGPLPPGPLMFSVQFVGVQGLFDPSIQHCGNAGWGFEASPALLVSY